MKQIFFLSIFSMLTLTMLAQNVGIGETNPGAKLTVKATGFLPSFLVKNSTDDSVMMTESKTIYLGGYYSLFGTGVVNISNKNFPALDIPQLELIAHSERSGAFVNGSMNLLRFSNANTNKFFVINSYLGANANLRSWGLDYQDPDDPNISYTMLRVKANGQIGLGTFNPVGKVQISHTATVSNPTLTLYDSSGTNLPVVSMRSGPGSNYWQLRGILDQTIPNESRLHFATRDGVQMSITGDGRVGIGLDDPAEKLDVAGNVRIMGELNRQSTNTANLVPIAYGTITAAGSIYSGSGNFSVGHPVAGTYTITITGETFVFNQYTTLITPTGGTVPVIPVTDSGSGSLIVNIYNTAGVRVNSIFNFVVYQQ